MLRARAKDRLRRLPLLQFLRNEDRLEGWQQTAAPGCEMVVFWRANGFNYVDVHAVTVTLKG